MDAKVSLFDRLFAVTIAFLLPGLAVLVGAATVMPVVAGWFGAASANPSLVGFLFVLAAALAIGLVLTSVRWYLFERLTIRGHSLVPRAEPINEGKRREHLAEYEDLRFQHYYHYLAYGNMAVAVPIAIAIWASGAFLETSWGLLLAVSTAGALLVAILSAAACEAITRYTHRRLRLLGPLQTR